MIGAYSFYVELEGLFVAGFSEVTGLEVETEYEEYREGGLNDYVHYVIKGTKYTPITLKRGVTTNRFLWDWYNEIRSGNVFRLSGSIVLTDDMGLEMCRWNFFDAYPIKWVGPDFNALASEVALESLTIAHNGFKREG